MRNNLILLFFVLELGVLHFPLSGQDRPTWRPERRNEASRRETTNSDWSRRPKIGEERQNSRELRDDVDRRTADEIRNARRSTLRENEAKGNRMRDQIAGRLRENGFLVDTEVNIRTESGGLYRADVVARSEVTGELVILESKNSGNTGIDNFRGERGTRQRERIGESAGGRATFEVGRGRRMETKIEHGQEVPRGTIKVVTAESAERVVSDIIQNSRLAAR